MKRFSLCVMIALFLFVAGCSLAVKDSEIQTSAPTLATKLFTTTPTLLTPSVLPTLTQMPTQFPSTLTPLPILSAEESITKLLTLLQNNGGCQLPCFLGYKPGITTPEVMNQFFNQFIDSAASNIEISHSQGTNRRAIQFYFPQSSLHFNAGISARENKNHTKIVFFGMGTFLTGKTEYPWDSAYEEAMKYYSLPNILAAHGKPPQILIETFQNDSQRPDVTTWPFFLSIIYPKQGIYAKYEMDRLSTGAKFIGCPSKSFISIVVWSPGDDEAFNQAVQAMNNGSDLSSYKPIDEATSITMDEFYQTYRNPENISCIKTPIEIWP